MKKCFVIQPFDGDTYDRLYDEVFSVAIEKAGISPYRVDRDLTSQDLLKSIISNIETSQICLAEISTDNPNVWFELGYALAKGKPTVLVCEENRRTKYPFDIQHRPVIGYKREHKSDFQKVEDEIQNRMESLLKEQEMKDALTANNPLKETAGLSPHEVATLATLASITCSVMESCYKHELINKVTMGGYTDLAVALSVQSLKEKGYVKENFDDFNGGSAIMWSITEKGMNWLNCNREQLNLVWSEDSQTTEEDDGIPF